MQPNLPQPTPLPPPPAPDPNAADYLDQISGPATQNTVSPFVLWGLIGGVLLVVVLFLVLLASSGGPNLGERLSSYIYRIQSLKELSDDSAKTIQSSELRAYNGSMNAILVGAEQEATSFLATSGVEKLKKLPPEHPVAVEFSELATTLDDARLNVVFDATYARQVAYQLSQLRAEITTLQDEAKDEEFKAALEETDTDLQPIIKQFNEFSNDAS